VCGLDARRTNVVSQFIFVVNHRLLTNEVTRIAKTFEVLGSGALSAQPTLSDSKPGISSALKFGARSPINWLVPAHDDKPCACSIAFAANQGHAFANGPQDSLNHFSILKSGHFSAVTAAQVNFDFSIFAEANASNFTGTDGDLASVKHPIVFPIQRGPQMPGYFDSDWAAAGFRWGVVIVTAHELDVKGVGLVFGRRRSVQNECNK
jgi:hypothetical protein